MSETNVVLLYYTFTHHLRGTATTCGTTALSDMGVELFHLFVLTPVAGFSFLKIHYFLFESTCQHMILLVFDTLNTQVVESHAVEGLSLGSHLAER